jgi:hypothetical protein
MDSFRFYSACSSAHLSARDELPSDPNLFPAGTSVAASLGSPPRSIYARSAPLPVAPRQRVPGRVDDRGGRHFIGPTRVEQWQRGTVAANFHHVLDHIHSIDWFLRNSRSTIIKLPVSAHS